MSTEDTRHANPDVSLLQRGRNALARLGFADTRKDEPASSDGSLSRLERGALRIDLDDPQERHLGDYELLELVGQGGMGVVYRARQKSLDREVAIKLLGASPWASADFVERFRYEAQSAARMQHRNIVTIHEIGADRDRTFFSMQYVSGTNLAKHVAAQGPLEPRAAARLLRTIAEAVDYAHGLNVLHLDLKPANVLLDADGVPLIADFGLARPLDHALAAAPDEISGTPSYMAPEQAELHRHALSRATDIYGLGAILFELLTGHPPFVGRDTADTLRRVVHEPAPKPRAERAKVPLDLDAICIRCLAKNPGDRYATARELADDLGRFVDGRPVSIRRPGAVERVVRWFRAEPVTASGLTMALLVVGAGLATAIALELRRTHETGLRGQAIELVTAALAAPADASPVARTKAVVERLVDDEPRNWATPYAERQQVLAELARSLRNTSPEQAVIASLGAEYLRFLSDRTPWIAELEARGTTDALLTAAFLVAADWPEPDHERLAELIRLAQVHGLTEPAHFALAAHACRGTGRVVCDLERLRAQWLVLEPDNLYVWATTTPSVWGDVSRDRFTGQSAYWTGRAVAYVNRFSDAAGRVRRELDAVAPRVLARIAHPHVDAQALVTMIVVRQLQNGFWGIGDLHGLDTYCRAPAADRETCAAIRVALVDGARSTTDAAAADVLDHVLRPDGRTQQETGYDSPDIAWLFRRARPLLVHEATYERDRRYVTMYEADGELAANRDLLLRHGIALTPPATWKP